MAHMKEYSRMEHRPKPPTMRNRSSKSGFFLGRVSLMRFPSSTIFSSCSAITLFDGLSDVYQKIRLFRKSLLSLAVAFVLHVKLKTLTIEPEINQDTRTDGFLITRPKEWKD